MSGKTIDGGSGRRAGWIVATLLATLAFAAFGPAGAAPPGERTARAVKAAFLLNFAKLVDWPEASFEQDKSPMIIGVLGEDPFRGLLEQVVRGRTAHGRPLEVRQLPVLNGELPPAERLTDCHLLFVGDSEEERLPQLFDRLAGASVMTVSDLEHFADDGGVAEFFLSGATIHFRFNLQAAEAAGLRPSARLLSVASLVDPSH